MVEYSRMAAPTAMLVRRGLQTAAALVAFSFVTSLSAFAQHGSTGNNSSQAVLHIRVNIVSVVTAPPAQPERRLASPVAYNIPDGNSNVETIEETRPLTNPGSSQRAIQGAVLRTLTIVPR